jgi:hypothetical protein
LFVSAGCEYRGTVAGNGGQMAGTTEAKLGQSAGKTKKARRKAGDAPTRKTTGRAGLKEGFEADARKVAKTSRKAKQEEAAGAAGEECLSATASKAVDRNKVNLTRHLLSEALHGKGQSGKLLLTLAETKTGQKDEEHDRPHQSLALLLEGEAEWQGEQSQAASETGEGNLEPEG